MLTRNVVLTDHQADLVEGLVSSGRYQNASEVLREGLRLIETRDVEEQARLEAPSGRCPEHHSERWDRHHESVKRQGWFYVVLAEEA